MFKSVDFIAPIKLIVETCNYFNLAAVGTVGDKTVLFTTIKIFHDKYNFKGKRKTLNGLKNVAGWNEDKSDDTLHLKIWQALKVTGCG